MLSLTDNWKGRLVTRGQARVSADSPLDRREEYFHFFKKALLKDTWAEKKKRESGDNELVRRVIMVHSVKFRAGSLIS